MRAKINKVLTGSLIAGAALEVARSKPAEKPKPDETPKPPLWTNIV